MKLSDLPPTLTSHEVAEVWRCPVDHVWRMAREGTSPVAPLRLGRSLRWPTNRVLAQLGVSEPREAEPSAP